ncbi:penicillin-binding protein 2 [soil metagenome]
MVPKSPFNPQARRQRALQAMLLIALSLGTVGAAFFRTQVVRNEDFVLRADDNRMRVVPIAAPRGAIFDRNGEMIAETETAFDLFLEPTTPDSARASLALLQSGLQLSDSAVSRTLRQMERQPRSPAAVASNLRFEQVAWVEERRAELTGVLLEPRPIRRYVQGEAVAHLVGYVAEISERELADSAWAGYRMGHLVGKAGIERQYERLLGGHAGERYVEVDARGRVQRSMATGRERPPSPGQDIHLSLDVELQRYAHKIFPRNRNGAVVAMVPSTGEVLALYSSPTYDPNLFTGGVSSSDWRSLNENPRRPLLNRATIGIYPPGSTWKLATALVGLEKGVITPETRMPIPCSGGMTYSGRYSRCWKKEGHGSLDLAGAIAHSCNVYFYQLGIRLGLNQLSREGTRLGFSRPTGIDLPGERVGTFPADAAWYNQRFGWAPTPSEVMSLSIGQGPNAQTPLRMVQFFAALAGDGTAPPPRLLARRTSEQVAAPETDLKLTGNSLRSSRVGLARVMEQGGTAYMSSLRNWKMYGKTGTSQNTQDLTKPHAWFTGFAGPIEGEPEIVIAVVVEFGESGSGAAAPLAAKLADFYLNSKHGIATDSLQTLSERTTRKVYRGN